MAEKTTVVKINLIYLVVGDIVHKPLSAWDAGWVSWRVPKVT